MTIQLEQSNHVFIADGTRENLCGRVAFILGAGEGELVERLRRARVREAGTAAWGTALFAGGSFCEEFAAKDPAGSNGCWGRHIQRNSIIQSLVDGGRHDHIDFAS